MTLLTTLTSSGRLGQLYMLLSPHLWNWARISIGRCFVNAMMRHPERSWISYRCNSVYTSESKSGYLCVGMVLDVWTAGSLHMWCCYLHSLLGWEMDWGDLAGVKCCFAFASMWITIHHVSETLNLLSSL